MCLWQREFFMENSERRTTGLVNMSITNQMSIHPLLLSEAEPRQMWKVIISSFNLESLTLHHGLFFWSSTYCRRTQHFNLQVCLSEYFCCSRDLWSSVLILNGLFKLTSGRMWISGLAENMLGCSTTTNIPLCFVTLSQLWYMLLAFTFRRTFPESCFKVWGCFPSNIFMCGWSGVWTDYGNRFVEYAKRNQDNLHNFSPQACACAATLYSSQFVPLVLRMR